jgi:hypothetical protein
MVVLEAVPPRTTSFDIVAPGPIKKLPLLIETFPDPSDPPPVAMRVPELTTVPPE